jgi:O-antigen/teichoic acid export membrane protein
VGRGADGREGCSEVTQPTATQEPVSDHSVLSDENVGRRVIHGGAQRVVGFMIANLLTAGSAVILLRYLKVDSFGRYGTVLALVGIVYGISDMGLTATGTRELALASTADERHDVMAHILGLRIVVTSLGVLAAVAFAVVAGYEGAMVIGTGLAGVGTLLQSVQVAMLMPLSVQMRNGALAVNQILTQAALLVGFGVLALIGAGLVPFFAVQILMGVVVLAATPVMLSRTDLVLPSWTPTRLRALGAVAVPVAVVTVIGVLYLRLLVIIMSLVSGQPRQLGYFVTSTRVIELVGGLPFLVISIVLPVVTVAARDDHRRLVYMTSRVAQVMMLCGVLVALDAVIDHRAHLRGPRIWTGGPGARDPGIRGDHDLPERRLAAGTHGDAPRPLTRGGLVRRGARSRDRRTGSDSG